MAGRCKGTLPCDNLGPGKGGRGVVLVAVDTPDDPVWVGPGDGGRDVVLVTLAVDRPANPICVWPGNDRCDVLDATVLASLETLFG